MSLLKRKMKMIPSISFLILCLTCLVHCKDDNAQEPTPAEQDTFYFGADLSYVNQILDRGGIYKDEGTVKSPYKIFKDHGSNLARVRLWHNPLWTKEIYGVSGTQKYNDLIDIEKSIRLSKEQGMNVLLDLHYSDTWADPGKQEMPKAWREIKTLSVLKDSVYQYTFKTLSYLDDKGLMPELVQIGNETNCGMLYTNAPSGFPSCEVCNTTQWQALGVIINSAIKAVEDVNASSSVKAKIILHVADPKNVEWWFDNVIGTGGVFGFDIIGFSYYPLWHRTISLENLSESISKFKNKYNRPVLVMETAYPWTTEHADDYSNQFGDQTPLAGYPFSVQGQQDIMIKLSQEVMDGGGAGIIYWEPAWISSPNVKDLWGTGSSWENNTFFDFQGSVLPSIDFMNHEYQKK